MYKNYRVFSIFMNVMRHVQSYVKLADNSGICLRKYQISPPFFNVVKTPGKTGKNNSGTQKVVNQVIETPEKGVIYLAICFCSSGSGFITSHRGLPIFARSKGQSQQI